MHEVVIYHNPRCSKSRETLELLRARGIEPRVVQYLEEPPTVAAIERLLELLNLEPRQLMRTHEEIYETLRLADIEDRAALVAAMAGHPILMERPIVVRNGKAAIGRPPEKVLDVL